jgi:glycosyltransferase involved in cell wall biosynthesis
VIDTSVTMTESDRSVVLLINPIASHGIDVFWEIARRMPDVAFHIQESWPLGEERRDAIVRIVSELPNVEFLDRVDPGPCLYARARMLIVPHQLDNRPRVVAEAQANGIPVVASDYPGLREAVGVGGVVVAPTDVDAWVQAIARLWNDPSTYDEFAAAALDHAGRDEINPDRVVDRFEEIVREALERRAASTGS